MTLDELDALVLPRFILPHSAARWPRHIAKARTQRRQRARLGRAPIDPQETP